MPREDRGGGAHRAEGDGERCSICWLSAKGGAKSTKPVSDMKKKEKLNARIRSWAGPRRHEGSQAQPKLRFPATAAAVPTFAASARSERVDRLGSPDPNPPRETSKLTTMAFNWIRSKIHLYNVTMGLYMLDWWERFLFNGVILVLLWFVCYTGSRSALEVYESHFKGRFMSNGNFSLGGDGKMLY